MEKNKISEHFNWEEFDCKDGTHVPRAYWGNCKLVATNLEVLRRVLGKPIEVVSGYRTLNHNKAVGGSPKSQHLTASGADIKCEGYTPEEIAAAIDIMTDNGNMKQGGLGIYKSWVHYDIRGTKERWRQ